MTLHIELATLGVLLVVAGALGLAVTGRVFRRQDDGRDRFFSTSLISVALIYAFCGGVFWIGKSAAGIPGAWGPIGGVLAAGFAVAAALLAWKLVGPRPVALQPGAGAP